MEDQPNTARSPYRCGPFHAVSLWSTSNEVIFTKAESVWFIPTHSSLLLTLIKHKLALSALSFLAHRIRETNRARWKVTSKNQLQNRVNNTP